MDHHFTKEEFLRYSRLKPCNLAAAEVEFSRLPMLCSQDLAFVPFLRQPERAGIVLRDQRVSLEAGINGEEWLEAAVENERNRIPVLKSLPGLLREMMEPGVEDIPPEVSLYYFAYEDMPYGSTVLLNQRALDAAAESLGRKKLTLLPSSTHELLIAPEAISPEELQATVYEVNRMGVVTPADKLSDCIYRYDPMTKEMERFDGICWQADVMEKKYARDQGFERKRPDDHELEF